MQLISHKLAKDYPNFDLIAFAQPSSLGEPKAIVITMS
ncbi:hypothetical protein APA_1644 [Pseudanabaena sp. lw0831]|nr:hypothetical protein APA_1644 [Pseudanabaena sp. lw0831]